MKQRLSARQLFWRGVVAALGNTAMATGVYPVVPHLGMVLARRRRGGPRPGHQGRAVGVEWAVSVGMSAARPLGFLPLPGARTHGPRPIVMVHGYAMSRTCFLVLARRLARAGLGPISGFEYWTLGRIASAARKLGRHIDAVLAHTGADRVDLVGHSMGGVVGRYFVALGGGADRVANLVTIGSPHRGADLSAVGLGRPTKELFPGSAFLQRLQAAPLPPGLAVTAIWSRSDALVPGASRARLAARGAGELVFDDLGHLSLLTSRRVADAIAERLAL